ncbi:MAG: F0F1 ATP synthase subunit gamma [Pseudomonadota bacterium]
MAGAKEIRTQISSIKGTQKITNAMQMVAASKMRKAQTYMELGKPYSRRIRSVISHLAQANTEYQHPYMQARDEIKNVGYIIVSSDRGLCGGLNVNVYKAALASMSEWQSQNVGVKVCTLGTKAQTFFQSIGADITASARDLGERPVLADLIGSIKVMLEAYTNGDIDRLYIVSNEYVNTMTQSPRVEQLLPLEASDDEELTHYWDYIYEPSAEFLLDGLLVRYIESQVYQAVVENVSCEQAARMLAMKNATDNAGSLIDELQLIYNRARQAAITQELSEIVGGAAAV